MNNSPFVALVAALPFAYDSPNPFTPEAPGPESAREHAAGGESGSEAGEAVAGPVVPEARGRSFSTWQVHIEIGQDEH